MLKATYTKKLERDLERLEKRGKDLEKIKAVVRAICNEESLAEKHRDHSLKGDWKGCRDCHIEPDWLLIYAIEKDEVVFYRTGTHSDLFG